MAYFEKQQAARNGLWYPKAKTIGRAVTTDDVAQRLADLSALSTGDVKSVLDLLGGVIGEYMNQGRTVKLDGVGTFYYTIDSSGNGVATPEEVSAKQINGTHVRFIPETSRGPKNEVTSRSLIGSNVFWELLSPDIPASAVDDAPEPGTGEDDDSGQGTFG